MAHCRHTREHSNTYSSQWSSLQTHLQAPLPNRLPLLGACPQFFSTHPEPVSAIRTFLHASLSSLPAARFAKPGLSSLLALGCSDTMV